MKLSLFLTFLILGTNQLTHAQIIPDRPTTPPRTFPQNQNPNSKKNDKFGKVIGRAGEIVALGESVYELIKKGKSTINTNDFTTINVVPLDPNTKNPVSLEDIEYSSQPVVKKYETKFKNSLGIVTASFKYQVVYSYGGSYDGKGKYLTNVSLVPTSTQIPWATNFNATMKVQKVGFRGSKDSPIAEVMLSIKYQYNSLGAVERNHLIYISGDGTIRNYGLE